MPDPAGTETLLRRIYAGQKYPHIYMLSISTCKNQSTEARGALYILTYEYSYKVITRCDTILQEYYITDRRKCENTKRCTSMNSIKGGSESSQENSRVEQGGLKGWDSGWSADDP